MWCRLLSLGILVRSSFVLYLVRCECPELPQAMEKGWLVSVSGPGTGLATQRSRLRRSLHPNSTSTPPPKLGKLCEPSVEIRALWEGRPVASESSENAGPP
eukprot:4857458-Pyramimonas_sp.AAC.1